MTMKRWNGSAMVDVSSAKRWNGTAMVDLTTAKRWTGSAFVDIPLPGGGGGPLSVVLSADSTSNFRFVPNGPSVVSLTTSPIAATSAGGTGSYTYSWTRVSGFTGIQADTPTSSSTSFTATLTKNSERSGVWRCTVSDGVNTAFAECTVDFAYYVGNIP